MAKKILLVDDEADFLEVVGERIRSWGYDCLYASNGKEALDAVRSKKPDMVILDYIMPVMDGVATLKEIRNIDDSLPVVMLTAHPDIKVIKGAEKLGVGAFIPKMSPYQSMQGALRSAINMALKVPSK